jgi:peptidoglycan/xylan/chitin deacetylase (PgdA/CDA1 family)
VVLTIASVVRPRLVGQIALVAVCIVGLVGLSSSSASPAMAERVWVDGRPVTITRPMRLFRVLLEARVPPIDGVLRSAATGRVLDAHADPAEITVDRRRARLSTEVRPGDRVVVYDGHDRVESTFLRVDPVAPDPSPPDVERDLWTPGTPGTAIDAVGEYSGEVVPRVTLTPSLPAAPVPGSTIALTFDDGPDPRSTPRILDILRRAGVHATFCMVGTQARAHPDLVRAVRDAGDTICDHTEHHPHLDQLSPAEVDGEIGSMATFLRDTTGAAPRFTRAPYGGVNATVVRTAHRYATRILGWSVDPSDYTKPPPLVIAGRVLAGAHPGAIVLMHDGGGDRTNTVLALPVIINALKARGYAIVQPSP